MSTQQHSRAAYRMLFVSCRERERATERGRHPDNNVELIREDKDMSHRWIYSRVQQYCWT